MKRIITAALLLPIFILAVLLPSRWPFELMIFLVGIICVLEFQSITAAAGAATYRLFAVAMTIALLCQGAYPQYLNLEIVILMGLAGLLILSTLSRKSLSSGVITNTAALFGPFYIGFLLRYPIMLHNEGVTVGAQLLFLLCGAVWIGDSAAFYVGKSIGKHPLHSLISPKKTWEGALGNLVGTTLYVLVSKFVYFEVLSWIDVFALGFLITVFSIGGDLFESVFKRSAGIKDSSGILPGHGGMLDRLDSLLFTSPLVFYYFQLVLK